MKLGTKAERLLSKHLYEIAAEPARHLGEARIHLLEPYFRGICAGFRAEHGRDPFSDSPWNSWACYCARRGFGGTGVFRALEERHGEGGAAFRKFIAFFNRYRAWSLARSCTAALEDAKSPLRVRRFLRAHGARTPRRRFAVRQYVIGGGRRFDAVVLRSSDWIEDEADAMDNRVAIAILDGGA